MGKITITENAADIELIYKGVDQNFFPNWDRHPLFGNFGRALSISVNLISQAHDTCYFAVIDGDEKDNLSAIICCILLCNSVFNSCGVFAHIASSQSL